MKMLMFNSSLGNSFDLAIDLIPMGLECLTVKTREDFIISLKNDQTIPIIMTENCKNGFLKEIREINPSINIFLLVKNTMKPEQIKSLSSFGITSIINYSANTGSIADEIVRCIVAQNIRRKDKRTHIRVKPKQGDDLKTAICVKKINRFIQGVVIDISAGGCAVCLDNPGETSFLVPKEVYDPLIVVIRGTGIKTLATLVGLRNNFAGFKFDNIEPAGMRRIAAYIHSRIIETSQPSGK